MQVDVSERDLAYFAGIIDGEGCFCLHNAGTHRFASQLAIGNTDVRLMQWIQQRFGGKVNEERRNHARHKKVYRWYANASDLDRLLPAVLPFLVIKRQQAELFIAYRATIAPVVRKKSSTFDTSEPVKRERSRIHAELSVLNKRGNAAISH